MPVDHDPTQPLFVATLAALRDVFTQPEPLVELVRVHLGQTLHQLTTWGGGATLNFAIFELVSWADSNDRLPDLVRALQAAHPARPTVATAYRLAFPTAPAAALAAVPACPYDASIVGTSLFIDRESIRTTLRTIANSPAGPRLLVVTGPACSGKTHSFLLIQGGGSHYQYQTAFIDVGALALEGGGVEAVIQDVVSKMGLDANGLSLPGETATARTTAKLASRAVGLIRNDFIERGTKWWIVFDSLDRETLAPATIAAVVCLASSFVTNLSNVRVCLLGYKGALVPPASAYVRREALLPVGQLELENWRHQMEGYFSVVLRGRDPTIGPDSVTAVVDRVIETIAAGPDMLCRLQQLADDAVMRMFAPEGDG
jgi:hypothetical protein